MVDYVGRLITVLDTDNSGLIKGLGIAETAVMGFTATVAESNKALELFGIGLGAALAVDVTKKVFEVGEAYTNLHRKIAVISNSMQELGYQNASTSDLMNMLAGQAEKMGVSFDKLANTFAKMSPMLIAHKIALSDINAMIVNTIGAGVLMGSTNEQMTRVFIALREIIAENALSMQHLRRQLGDALPNAMLIIVQGANKVKNSFANLRNETEITWSTIQKLIHSKSIDDKEFVAMWVAGTEGMNRFAEAQKAQITGQLVNLQNFFQYDIGKFMSESGLNQYFAGLLDVINAKLREVMKGMDPKEFAEKFEAGFERIAKGTAQIWDDIQPIVSMLTSVGAELWSSFQKLPPEMQTVGIIGLLAFGTAGKVAVITGIELAPEIDALIGRIRAMEDAAKDEGLKGIFDPFRLALEDMKHLDDFMTRADLNHMLVNFGQLPMAMARIITDAHNAATDKLDVLKKVFDEKLAALAADQKNYKFDPGSWLLPTREGIKHALDGQAEQMRRLKSEIGDLGGQLHMLNGVWDGVMNRISDPAEAQKAIQQLTEMRTNYAAILDTMKSSGATDKETEGYRKMITLLDDYIAQLQKKTGIEKQSSESSGSAADALDRIFKAAREKGGEFKGLLADMEKAQGLIKAMAEDKEPALRELTPTQMNAGMEELIHNFNVLGKDYAIDTITDKFRKLTDYLNSDVTQAFIRIYEKMSGLRDVAEQIRFGGIEETLTKLSHISFTGSPANMKEQFGATRQAMSELHDEFMKDGGAMHKSVKELNAEWGFLQQELQSNYNSHIFKREAADDSPIRKMLDAQIAAAKSLTEGYTKASEALYNYLYNRRLFNAEAEKEKFLVAKGEVDPGAMVGNKNEAQLREMVIQGKLADGKKRLFDLDQQALALTDKDVIAQTAEEELATLELNHRKAIAELRAHANPAYESALIKERNDSFAKEMQTLQLKRAVQDNPEAIRQTLQLEMEKLKDEYRNLLLKITLQSSGQYQQLYVQTEVTKLVAQEVDLRNQLKLATDGAYLAEERKVQALQEQLKLQQMINSYQVDFGTYLKNNVMKDTGQFTSMFSNAITGLITGTRTLKQTFQDLFKNIIGQIVQMFVTWALQRAIAWALQAAGLVEATAETTAAATAASAAWMPAAYFASVATMGGAAATGAAALTAGLASVTASSAAVGAAGALGGAVPARAEGGPVNASEFYLVGEKGPELFRPNTGGSIIPNHQMDSLLDGMHRSKMSHAGLERGHLDTAADRMDGYMIKSMAAPKAEIVNYFSHDEVMKHIARNPAAIVNVMVQDHRNGGPMRKIAPTRRN
jgi:hypothetical protein